MSDYKPLEPARFHYSGSAELVQIKVYRGEWIGIQVERPDKPFNDERHYVEISVSHDGEVKICASEGTPPIEYWTDDSPAPEGGDQ